MSRILIIEDEVTLNKALADALKDAGFEVVQTYNGDEGLKQAIDDGFEVILLDLVMPVRDGFSFLDAYLSEEADPSHVIVLTNLSDFSSQMKTYRKGIVSYLIKADVSLSDIVKKVKSLILERS